MQKIRFHVLSFIFFLLAANVAAQQSSPKPTFIKKQTGEAKGILIVQIPDEMPLTKLRLYNETQDASIPADVPADNTVLFEIDLTKGENRFNLIGYRNDKIVFTSAAPIVFVGGETAATVRTAKPATGASANQTATKLSLSSQKIGGNKMRIYVAPDGVKLFEEPDEIPNGDPDKFPTEKYVYLYEIKNGSEKKRDEKKIEFVGGTADPKSPQSPQPIDVILTEGTNTITVYPRINGKEKTELAAETKIVCKNCVGDNDEADANSNLRSQNFRALAGFQQVGASSANSEAHPYLNFFFRTPLGKRKISTGENEPQNDRREFAVWGDISFTPTAVQDVANLSNFSATLGGDKFKPNNIVDSFDFRLGLEYELVRRGSLFSGIFPGKSTLSLIASAGAVLPLSSDKTTVYYKIPRVNNIVDPRFLKLFPQTTTETNIAFVTPDRDRFFRQYYGGFRLKTFFYEKGDGETKPLDVFPAMFDLTVGQNEAITGKPQGVVMRLDGSTPFPIRGADFLHLFGGVQMKLGKNVNRQIPPFFLEPAAAGASLTSTDTLVVPVDQSPFLKSNRDIFRIGVGVDLFKVFKPSKTP